MSEEEATAICSEGRRRRRRRRKAERNWAVDGRGFGAFKIVHAV